MAPTRTGSSGVTRGRNRRTTSPSGEMRNFSKFHWMSPLSPSASAVGRELLVEGVTAVPVHLDLGEHREGHAVVGLAELLDLVGRPGSWAPNWLQGKPSTAKPRSP